VDNEANCVSLHDCSEPLSHTQIHNGSLQSCNETQLASLSTCATLVSEPTFNRTLVWIPKQLYDKEKEHAGNGRVSVGKCCFQNKKRHLNNLEAQGKIVHDQNLCEVANVKHQTYWWKCDTKREKASKLLWELPLDCDKEGNRLVPLDCSDTNCVYYSEELKYAVGLGYKVVPISGYLFERKESPFKDFVSSLFSSRLEARKEGNDALSYVYKILMNSLYGRFGINPKSTITEVCNFKRYTDVVSFEGFIHGDMLSENNFIVSYHTNTGNDGTHWNPPKNSAVQLAAAITASARIYMYPYISRDDCYYTDTDSVVLSQPLPEELISSSILGMLKLEDQIVKGFFLAPKAYSYYTLEGSTVKKYKGPAKDKVTPEWFEKQYAEPSRRVQVKVDAKFRIDWESLEIKNQEIIFSLGLKEGSKRLPVYDSNKNWVDTEPIAIHDLSNIDYISRKVISSLSDRVLHLENERLNEKLEERNREIAKLKSQIEVQTGVTNQTLVEKKTDMKTKTDEEKPP
ncbi:DNA polymerase-like protein, partial [Tanacetum coccineum]